MRGLIYYLIPLFLSYASKGCQTRRIYLCISDTIFNVLRNYRLQNTRKDNGKEYTFNTAYIINIYIEKIGSR